MINCDNIVSILKSFSFMKFFIVTCFVLAVILTTNVCAKLNLKNEFSKNGISDEQLSSTYEIKLKGDQGSDDSVTCFGREVEGRMMDISSVGEEGGDGLSYVIATGSNLKKDDCAQECCEAPQCNGIVWYSESDKSKRRYTCYLMSCPNLLCMVYSQNITKTDSVNGVSILIGRSIDKIPTPTFATSNLDPSRNELSANEGEHQSSNSEEQQNNLSNRIDTNSHNSKDFGLANHSFSSHSNPYVLPSVVLIMGVSLSILAVIFLYQFLRDEINREGYIEMRKSEDAENSSSSDFSATYGEVIKENEQEFFLD